MLFSSTASLVAEHIAGILNQGIRLSPRTMHFIDSTFASPSVQDIRTFMADPDNCEREVLVQLIFFPDEPIQEQLEPCLQQHPLTTQDIPVVLTRIKALVTAIPVYLPENRGSFFLNFSPVHGEPDVEPDLALAHFVFHLNASKCLPPELIRAIDQGVTPEKNIRTKVRLRNSRIDFTGENIIWLGRLFRAYPRFSGVYDEILDFALAFLTGIPEGADFYDRLMALKITYFKAVEKNTAFNAQMRRSNVETLFMQGKRPGGMDSITAMKKITLIDRISTALYGKTLPIGGMISETDLGEARTVDDLETILKRLG